MTKREFKAAKQTWQRMEQGLPMTPEATEEIVFKPIKNLFDSIHAEPSVEKQLNELKDIQLFIMSGKSLVAWSRERGNNQLLAWERLPMPPLPASPYPPNKCLAPAFAV